MCNLPEASWRNLGPAWGFSLSVKERKAKHAREKLLLKVWLWLLYLYRQNIRFLSGKTIAFNDQLKLYFFLCCASPLQGLNFVVWPLFSACLPVCSMVLGTLEPWHCRGREHMIERAHYSFTCRQCPNPEENTLNFCIMSWTSCFSWLRFRAAFPPLLGNDGSDSMSRNRLENWSIFNMCLYWGDWTWLLTFLVLKRGACLCC